MTPIALAITEALLARHQAECQPGRPVNSCTIPYRQLCELAGYAEIVQSVGRYLRETAEWCAENNYPPLNALAVNAISQMPGDNYDLAAGCNLLSWPDEVRTCIEFQGYPTEV